MATLTFDDEFNTLSLWNGTTGTWMTSNLGAPLSGNGWSPTGEQEWYINSNYAPTSSVTPWTVNNGILTITAAPASPSIQSLIDGYQYTSGRITNAESFSQTYGYFEMRAQMPAGQGLWPAFWLLDTNGQWPPEMDVIEQLGKDPSVYYTFVHSTNSQLDTGGQPIATSPGYHTYGVDWEASTITFYFDGQKVAQTATPPDLNQPMSMILNLALGGGWAGAVDPSVLPAQMNVDWIRAYSALPSWIADGSDPTDVAHTPASAIGSTGGGTTTGGGGTTTGGGGTTGGGTTSSPVMDAAATYTVPAGVTNVVLTGTSAQTITANNLGDTITSNDHGSTLIGGTGNDTMIAGHGPDMLTGGGGSDAFVFKFAPWSAGHITDFTPGTDKIDVSAMLTAFGYTGSNAIADGWLILNSDGAGDTQVMVNPHDPSWPWSYLVTTVDHVAPASLGLTDFGVAASSTGGGTTTGGGGTTSGGGGTTTGGGTTSSPVMDAAATYTVPAGVTNVVLTGTSAQTITANNLGDTITSNDHGSTLIGGTGNDTMIAGHGPDMLTGGGGSDSFVFNFAPWSAGHITDFTPGTDTMNLSGVLSAYGYTGTNPVADGWLSFVADGAGNTRVMVNPHDPSWPWSYLITTLDHVAPATITSHDWIFHA